jgi:heterodisulfide reductase subunit B
MDRNRFELSYFPGCSLATTARENNQSLTAVCDRLGYRLIELEDWNCCGSSSAHSLKTGLADDLAARNLSLAPAGRPLLIPCPNCLIRLRHTQHKLMNDKGMQRDFKKKFNRAFNEDLKLLSFFDLIEDSGPLRFISRNEAHGLEGLRVAAYYGCMLNRPPDLKHDHNYYGLMEKTLLSMGAKPVDWAYPSRCCGTFLSVARPDIASPIVNKIVEEALESGAECLVTACAMCQLNLEVRCSLPEKLPVLHFSEILAIGCGVDVGKKWFSRHLVDPRPLLKAHGIRGA